MKYAALTAVVIAAFTGTASAGVGNGKPTPSQGEAHSQSTANNGNGNGAQPAPQDGATDPSATSDTSSTAATGNSGASPQTPPGQANAAASPSPGQAKQQAKANAPGVKPSNTTHKWTTCTLGGSPSSPTCSGNGPKADGSKQYGNGTTAAQVALANGAPAGTVLTGPGNSQPHKLTGCGMPDNRSGGVDVHAYHPGDCPTTAAPATATPATAAPAAAAPPAPVADVPAPPDVVAVASVAPPTPVLPTGGVLGEKVTLKRDTPGATRTLADYVVKKNLPFTGFRLWIVALTGLALLAGGLALRTRRTAL